MTPSDADSTAAGLIDYIAAAPSPFHACLASARLLQAAGFVGMTESSPFPTAPGRYFLIRAGSLVAFSTEHLPGGKPSRARASGSQSRGGNGSASRGAGGTGSRGASASASRGAAGAIPGFRVVGAHTDSPNLRIKPQPGITSAGWQQLGVEVYGGPLLNSWLDRDLGLSGRVAVRANALPDSVTPALGETAATPGQPVRAPGPDPAGVATVLIHLDEPLLRVAQLAIHLDRTVNSEGLQLNQQQHLAPIWGLGGEQPDFYAFLAERIGVEPSDVLGFDIMTHDVQPPARIGAQAELLAAPRLDNLATSFAGTRALIAATEHAARQSARGQDATGQDAAGQDAAGRDAAGRAKGGTSSYPIPVLALFDHEEVGSTSERGAQSPLLTDVLERIVLARGGSRDDYHRAMASSIVASGDMAHATHPNYVTKHEPDHHIAIDGGPVLKINNQLRYATGAPGAAAFTLACEQAGVPMQRFVTRSDLPCGSTVGPMTAARTGCETVDFGAPMLSMHSARELAGVRDQAMYADALTAFLAPGR